MTATVTLNHGGALPLVGFGTWQLRGGSAYDAVRHALDVGYRHLDTATMYGNEEEVGRALRDSGVPREDVFLTTKLPPERAGRERATLQASLKALDTPYVDLWLIHWPPRGGAGVPTWREFVTAREDGLVRAVGVSNYSIARIDELITATGVVPAVNQVPWSPVEHDPGHLAQSARRGVLVEGYSSLKRTNLDDPVLVEIAGRHGVSVARLVLRWHLEHGIPVIPKSAHRERIEANFALEFSLDADEVARIDALSSA